MRATPTCATALSIVLLLPDGGARAQPGTYTPFGSGCQSSGKHEDPCQELNFMPYRRQQHSLSGEVAYGVRAEGGLAVTGFELYCRSKTDAHETMLCALYLDSDNGTPSTTPAAIGRMTVGPQLKPYRVRLVPRVFVGGGDLFWISQYETTKVAAASLTRGNSPSLPTYHRDAAGSPTAWSEIEIAHPSWRIRCCDGGGAATPVLVGFDQPTIGKPFTVQLHQAPEAGNAALFFGASEQTFRGLTLPFAMTPIGSPASCSMFVSGELVCPAFIDPCGWASCTVTIPNDADLVGATFFNQWFVVDTSGWPNAHVVSSNAGAAVIGAE